MATKKNPQGHRAHGLKRSLCAILGTVLIGILTGCGGACKAVSADRSMFESRTAESGAALNEAPHMIFEVPFELIDRQLEAALRASGKGTVKLSTLDGLSKGLGRVSLHLTGVKTQRARRGRVGIHLVFEARSRRKVLFRLLADTEVKPAVDLERGELMIALGPDAIRRLKPKPGPGATRSLARALRDLLPAVARRYTPLKLLEKAAAEGISALVEHGFTALRDGPLATVGPLTEIRIKLPNVPIRSVGISTTKRTVQVAIHTSLPVSMGVSRRPAGSKGHRIRAVISGATLVELVNYAMAEAAIPNRYSSSGKADPKGDYLAALRWQPGKDHPLVARLWKQSGQCMVAELEAVPKAAVSRKKGRTMVRLRAVDGRIARVEGSVLFQIGAFLKSLSAQSIKVAKRVSGETAFKVGGRSVRLEILRIGFDGDDLALEIDARGRRR